MKFFVHTLLLCGVLIVHNDGHSIKKRFIDFDRLVRLDIFTHGNKHSPLYNAESNNPEIHIYKSGNSGGEGTHEPLNEEGANSLQPPEIRIYNPEGRNGPPEIHIFNHNKSGGKEKDEPPSPEGTNNTNNTNPQDINNINRNNSVGEGTQQSPNQAAGFNPQEFYNFNPNNNGGEGTNQPPNQAGGFNPQGVNYFNRGEGANQPPNQAGGFKPQDVNYFNPNNNGGEGTNQPPNQAGGFNPQEVNYFNPTKNGGEGANQAGGFNPKEANTAFTNNNGGEGTNLTPNQAGGFNPQEANSLHTTNNGGNKQPGSDSLNPQDIYNLNPNNTSMGPVQDRSIGFQPQAQGQPANIQPRSTSFIQPGSVPYNTNYNDPRNNYQSQLNGIPNDNRDQPQFAGQFQPQLNQNMQPNNNPYNNYNQARGQLQVPSNGYQTQPNGIQNNGGGVASPNFQNQLNRNMQPNYNPYNNYNQPRGQLQVPKNSYQSQPNGFPNKFGDQAQVLDPNFQTIPSPNYNPINNSGKGQLPAAPITHQPEPNGIPNNGGGQPEPSSVNSHMQMNSGITLKNSNTFNGR